MLKKILQVMVWIELILAGINYAGFLTTWFSRGYFSFISFSTFVICIGTSCFIESSLQGGGDHE